MSGENCLTGLKILDLTQFEAGPSCTEALAWMGADVVKVENPGAGDPGGTIGRTARYGRALFPAVQFQQALGGGQSEGPARRSSSSRAWRRRADVMIENFAPGAIERLGLGYEAIKAINPSIIYCQIKGFGTGSPYEKNLAFDMIAQACGGLMSHHRRGGRPAVQAGRDHRRYRHRHADGDLDPRRLCPPPAHRPGRASAGGDAGLDHALHPQRLRLHGAHRRQAGAARRIAERSGGGHPPIGVYPCKGGGPNDYVYIYTSAPIPSTGRAC